MKAREKAISSSFILILLCSTFLPGLHTILVSASSVQFRTSQLNGDWGINSYGGIWEISPVYRQFPLGSNSDVSGTLTIFAEAPSQGIVNGRKYGFGRWDCTGSISVDDPSSDTTNLHVNGPGTVTAVYYRWDITIDVYPTNPTANAGDEVFFDFTVTAVEPVPDSGNCNGGIQTENLPSGWVQGGGASFVLNRNQKTVTLHPTITSTIDSNGQYTFQLVGYITSTSSQYWKKKTITMNVAPRPKPDLVVTGIRTFPSNPSTGNTITIYATIMNQGEGDCLSEFRVAAWVDYPTAPPPYLGNFYVNSLNHGQSVEKAFDPTWVLTAGSHEIMVKADSSEAIQETNEENNIGYHQIGIKPQIQTTTTLSLNPNRYKPNDGFDITLSGRVTRNDNDQGLADVPVRLYVPDYYPTVRTNSSGYYSWLGYVSGLDEGTYPCTATFDAIDSPTQTIFGSTATANLYIELPIPTFTIDWLVSLYSVYVKGSEPEFVARVVNVGDVPIDAYELQADFTVIDPFGQEIYTGKGWNTNKIVNGELVAISNTDDSWIIPSNAIHGWYRLVATVTHSKTSTSKTRETPDAFGVDSLPPPDFEILASQNFYEVTQGQSITANIGVCSIGGYNKQVSLSVISPPPGLSIMLDPDSIVPTSYSTLTIGTSSFNHVGTFDLIMHATDGNRTHTYVITIRVNPSTVSLSVDQMKTDKTSYSPTDQITFTFDVTNFGTIQSFKPKIGVKDLGVFTMPNYVTLEHNEKRTISFSVNYPPGWPVGSQNWKITLVGPNPSDSCTYTDTGFISSFMVVGGDVFTVSLSARFLSDISALEPLPSAIINIDSTQYKGIRDLPTSIKIKSGSHNIYTFQNLVPLGSTYYFDHWEWDKSNNNVVPHSETDDPTTITINGNGYLIAVFVKFSVTLSFPTNKTLKPSSMGGDGSDMMTFKVKITTHSSSKRSTLYTIIEISGPPGAKNLGLNSEPTMHGESGIQPYTLGSNIPNSYTFGPITLNSIPGIYHVSAYVFDGSTETAMVLSVVSSIFMVDVGRSYIEAEGLTANKIIHVHYAQEDIGRGAHTKVRDMLIFWDVIKLVKDPRDLLNTVGSGFESSKNFIKLSAELLEIGQTEAGWLEEDARINTDGTYDLTILQTIGERGKFYQCAPNKVLSEIKREIGLAFFMAGVGLALIATGVGATIGVPAFILSVGVIVADYLLPIGEWFDIDLPGYGRFVPEFVTSSINVEKMQSLGVTLTIPVQTSETKENPLELNEMVYNPEALPVNALTPANTETSTEILSITPSQIMQAEPGATIDFTINYNIIQEFSDNEVNQLILFCDSSGWPPQDGSYFQIYSGIPSRAGTLGTAEIQITVPNEPGHYYYWFGLNIGDDLERAADQFRGSFIPSLPHLRVDVEELNEAPVLDSIGNRILNEFTTLTFTATATDSDAPAQTLTYSLIDAPAEANIDPSTGVFTWIPSEAQGPGVYTFTVVVSDGELTDQETITVTVNEVNLAPTLSLIGDKSVDELNSLSFTATACDNDIPVQSLTFSLVDAPTGANINSVTGVFTWTPTEAQGPNSYIFNIVVSDGYLTDSETITVTVNESRTMVSVSIYPGWNLVGMPGYVTDSRIQAIFEGNLGSVKAVYGYEDKEWTYWIPGIPSTLNALEAGHGYWLLSDSKYNVTITAYQTDPEPLQQGWNLISSTDSEDVSVEHFLEGTNWSMIYSYDSSNGDWLYNIKGIGGSINVLEPGRGYWVFIAASVAPRLTMIPSNGTYNSPLNVSISSPISGSIIRYTTDGSDPVGGLTYKGSFSLEDWGDYVIRSIAVKGGEVVGECQGIYRVVDPNPILGEIGGLHYVTWNFGRDDLQSINFTIRIYDEPSSVDGLYYQMYQGAINGEGFYFGLQTDVFKPGVGSSGKGLIFSRWGTRDLSNARVSEGGWTQSAGYEGDFIGIRMNYPWTTHTYRLRIAKMESDEVGDWYGIWIRDLEAGSETYFGALRFPRSLTLDGIQDGGITWTELYYKSVQATPLPSWHVSIVEVRADDTVVPQHAYSSYSQIGHTDIYMDNNGEIHFLMGTHIRRIHSPGELY